MIFENVQVPVESRLGGEGAGFRLIMETLDKLRAEVAAMAVGVA